MFNHADLNAKLDRVLTDGAIARALQQRIHAQGASIMSTQSDILNALKGSAEANDRARRAIVALEAEKADLTSQRAAAKTQAGETVDPGAVQAAIDTSTAAAKALTDAIPAGADHVVGAGATGAAAGPAAAADAAAASASAAVTGTPAAAAAPAASAGAKVVALAPNPAADAAAMSSAGTPSAGLVGAAGGDSAKPAIGAVSTV